jgi:hypothetical protein
MRIRKLLAAALVLGTLTPVVAVVSETVTPASAEVYQCGTVGHYFDGAYTSTNTVVGTSASIVNRLGAVCDTDTSNTNSSLAWSMLAGANGSCQYAQAGFVRFYGTTDRFFAQDNDCSVVDTTYGVSLASYGETHRYWVQNITTCGCLSTCLETGCRQRSS